MLKIDFTPSLASERSDHARDLSIVDQADLRYSVFLGDIGFVVGTQDFSARWGWVPLLDFAVALRDIVRMLPKTGSEAFQFTESSAELRFVACDDIVEVRSNYTESVGRIPRTELENTSRKFAYDVFDAAVVIHPTLAQNAAFSQLRMQLD